MQSKSLLIAIAAFAVTTTGAHAFGSSAVLNRANLSDEHKSALEQARELKESGNIDGARDLLVEAGVDEEVLRTLHKARKEFRKEIHELALNGDYETFMEAIVVTPLSDVITNESDFKSFQAAVELRVSGEYTEAREILEELGVEPKRRHHKIRGALAQLSEEEKDALQVAKQANDKETFKAILKDAGIEGPFVRR